MVIPVISTLPVSVSSLSDAPGLVEVLIPIFDVVWSPTPALSLINVVNPYPIKLFTALFPTVN